MPPTKAITAKQEGATLQIFRGDEHVANYDAVSEETSYVKEEFKRYKNPVEKFLKEHNDILEEGKKEKEANTNKEAPAKATEAPDGEDSATTIQLLEKRVESLTETNEDLQSKNEALQAELAKQRAVNGADSGPVGEFPVSGNETKSRDPRYSDDIDESNAPAQDPMQGDLTPAYIEWARENMPKEVFRRRYNRRIPEFK